MAGTSTTPWRQYILRYLVIMNCQSEIADEDDTYHGQGEKLGYCTAHASLKRHQACSVHQTSRLVTVDRVGDHIKKKCSARAGGGVIHSLNRSSMCEKFGRAVSYFFYTPSSTDITVVPQSLNKKRVFLKVSPHTTLYYICF